MAAGTSSYDAKYEWPNRGDAYGDEMESNLARADRQMTQIVGIAPRWAAVAANGDLYVITNGQIGTASQWTLGASARQAFSTRNNAYIDAPERSGFYYHYIDLSAFPLTAQEVGMSGADIGESYGMLLFQLWEEISSVWISVASGWAEIDWSNPM